MSALFQNKGEILVIGDVILDIYYSGKVDRVSPEAPVPVVQVQKIQKKLGGAANVAHNISKLKNSVILKGYCGKDQNSIHLKKILDSSNIQHDLIETEQPTINKIRVVSGVQQIVRIDFEEKYELSTQLKDKQINAIMPDVNNCDVTIISDYGKGFITDDISISIINEANRLNKIVIVDPKGINWEKYRNATIATPNLKELSEIVGYPIDNNNDELIEKAGKEIQQKYNFKYLLVTRSEKGMSFFDEDHIEHIRTLATEVFDVSGAGDTVVATLATALSSGYSWIEGVKLANKAAGIVVSKIGTEPITYEELEDVIEGYHEENKIIKNNDLKFTIDNIKAQGKKIVFTNGCFDIIHKGHIKYLQKAKKYGDVLIIGLNSDSSVKKLKGEGRPIKDEDERSIILSALAVVDYITVFNDETPYSTIKIIEPDFLVKGGDYKIEEIVGREFSKETIIIPFIDGYSTTSTIFKIKKQPKSS